MFTKFVAYVRFSLIIIFPVHHRYTKTHKGVVSGDNNLLNFGKHVSLLNKRAKLDLGNAQ